MAMALNIRPLKNPYRRSVKVLKSIINEVEKEGKRPSTAYYFSKSRIRGL